MVVFWRLLSTENLQSIVAFAQGELHRRANGTNFSCSHAIDETCCQSEDFDPYHQMGYEIGGLSKNKDQAARSGLTGAYDIHVDPRGEPLGLEYEATTLGMMVLQVRAGAMRTHNVCSPNTAYVYRRDFIVGVNGENRVEAMAEELEGSGPFNFDMVHPKTWRAYVDKQSLRLGMQLQALSSSSTVLEIKSIDKAGSVAAHNEGCEPDRRLKPRDLIVAVNEVADDQVAMLKEMNTQEVVQLDMVRVSCFFQGGEATAISPTKVSLDRSHTEGTAMALKYLQSSPKKASPASNSSSKKDLLFGSITSPKGNKKVAAS